MRFVSKTAYLLPFALFVGNCLANDNAHRLNFAKRRANNSKMFVRLSSK